MRPIGDNCFFRCSDGSAPGCYCAPQVRWTQWARCLARVLPSGLGQLRKTFLPGMRPAQHVPIKLTRMANSGPTHHATVAATGMNRHAKSFSRVP